MHQLQIFNYLFHRFGTVAPISKVEDEIVYLNVNFSLLNSSDINMLSDFGCYIEEDRELIYFYVLGGVL